MKSKIEIKVRGYHEDHFQHVNNARYLEFLEEARWSYFDEFNLIENLFHKEGIFLAVVNVNISYLRKAGAGDVLIIETEIKKTEGRKVIMSQKVYLKTSNKLIVDSEITNIFVNAESGSAILINMDMVAIWSDLDKKYS